MALIIRLWGIDTSVLVRLMTRDTLDEYKRCVAALTDIVENQNGEVVVSNQAIGEAYAAVQHHYGATESEARTKVLNIFRSGLIRPLSGSRITRILQTARGAGLVDHLILDGYSESGYETLTLDKKWATCLVLGVCKCESSGSFTTVSPTRYIWEL